MKSPLKLAKWPIFMYMFGSIFFIGIVSYSFFLSGGEFTVSRVLASLGTIILFTFAGWVISYYFASTFLHRKVKNQVEPNHLVAGHTYWLNGQTPAKFLGVMDHTGKYLFHIEGLNNKNKPEEAKDLSPDQVRQYISLHKED